MDTLVCFEIVDEECRSPRKNCCSRTRQSDD